MLSPAAAFALSVDVLPAGLEKLNPLQFVVAFDDATDYDNNLTTGCASYDSWRLTYDNDTGSFGGIFTIETDPNIGFAGSPYILNTTLAAGTYAAPEFWCFNAGDLAGGVSVANFSYPSYDVLSGLILSISTDLVPQFTARITDTIAAPGNLLVIVYAIGLILSFYVITRTIGIFKPATPTIADERATPRRRRSRRRRDKESGDLLMYAIEDNRIREGFRDINGD